MIADKLSASVVSKASRRASRTAAPVHSGLRRYMTSKTYIDHDPEGMQFYSSAATRLTDGIYVMFPAACYTKNQTSRSHLAWSRDGVHFTRYGREPVVDLGTTFDTKGVYVMPGATPGDEPNTWWFYYFGTNVEHDTNPEDIEYSGGAGRFLLVLE